MPADRSAHNALDHARILDCANEKFNAVGKILRVGCGVRQGDHAVGEPGCKCGHLRVRDGTQRLLKEQVDEEDIADVVSRWTHIPVSRLMEGELQKLVRMEERLGALWLTPDER